MIQTKENKLRPTLRFPEFEKDGEWIEITIEKLIQENVLFPPKDGNHGNIHPKSADYVKKGIPFIMASDLKNGKVNFKTCAYLRKEQADSLQKGFAESGDVLLTHKGTVGEVAIIDDIQFPYIMLTPQVTYYRINDQSRISNNFLAVFFNSAFFQNNLLKVSGGGTRAYVGITKQQEFEIHYPVNLLEQQKIASCLSSLDELLAAHTDKLEALRDHKKGLMQNLFPSSETGFARLKDGQDDKKGKILKSNNPENPNSDNVPNYRFPEFENDGEWEMKPISEVFSIFQGYAFSSNDSTLQGTRWLKISDVGIQKMNPTSQSYLPSNFKDIHERFLLQKGDYVMALTRPILSKHLKIAMVDDEYHNSLLNQRVGKLVTSNEKRFIYNLLQTTTLIDSIEKNIAGNDPPNLSMQQISDIVVSIPKDVKEQQKIASCLSEVDALITGQTEKIEQLQQHKKGLMQGLFPKIEN